MTENNRHNTHVARIRGMISWREQLDAEGSTSRHRTAELEALRYMLFLVENNEGES